MDDCRIRRRNEWPPLLGALGISLLALAAMPARAGGFYFTEVGSPLSVGTAGAANVTNTLSADAAWTNPAGLTRMNNEGILVGLQVIAPTIKFDSDVAEKGGSDGGDAGEPAGVPSFYFAYRLSEKWHYGFGFSALQGGGADFGDDFVGRYAATKVAITGVGATYSLGYEVTDRLSLGFGGSLIYTTFEQNVALNLGDLPDGRVKVQDADDLGIQPIVGLQYAISDRLLFGMNYRAKFDAELKGNLRFSRIPEGVPLPRQTNVELDWHNPQWLDVGFRFGEPGGTELFVSGSWQDWSEFSENQIGIDTQAGNRVTTVDRDWDDTWTAAVGFARGDYYSGWSVGAAYESSPVDDDKRTIDFAVDEYWKLSGAYGRRTESGRAWSVGATLQLVGGAEVDQTSQGVRFAGDFSDYYVVYAGFTMLF
jgi:long-chain fatty acid transport protein